MEKEYEFFFRNQPRNSDEVSLNESDSDSSESDNTVGPDIILSRHKNQIDLVPPTTSKNDTKVDPETEKLTAFLQQHNLLKTDKNLTNNPNKQSESFIHDIVKVDFPESISNNINYQRETFPPNDFEEDDPPEIVTGNKTSEDNFKDLRKSLTDEINIFDKWVSKSFIQLVKTLEASPKDEEVCWNRLLGLRAKLNKLCEKHKNEKKDSNKFKPYICLKCKEQCLFFPLNLYAECVEHHKAMHSLEEPAAPKPKKPVNSSNASFVPMAGMYYPHKLMQSVFLAEQINTKRCKNIQLASGNLYRCLLCMVEVSGEKNLMSHVRGKMHQEFLVDDNATNCVAIFHKWWNNISNEELKLHQVYFFPDKKNSVDCSLCDTSVHYANLVEHIAGRLHTSKLNVKGPAWAVPTISRSSSVSSLVENHNNPLKAAKKQKAPDSKGNPSVGKSSQPNVNDKKQTTDVLSNWRLTQNVNSVPIATLIKDPQIDQQTAKPTFNLAKIPAIIKKEVPNVSEKIKENIVPMNDTSVQSLKDKLMSSIQNKTSINDLHDNLKQILTLTEKELNNKPPIGEKKLTMTEDSLWKDIQDRFLINKRFVNKVNDSDNLYCSVCCIFLKYNSISLSAHLTEPKHINILSNLGYPKVKYDYICAVCKINIGLEIKWQEHCKDQNHVIRCLQKTSTPSITLKERTCRHCPGIIIYCDEKEMQTHTHFKKERKKKVLKLTPGLTKLFTNTATLEERGEKLARSAEQVMLNDNADIECCRALELGLKEEYPECKAYRFGSRVSGLGNVESDLDVFLDTGNMYTGMRNQDPKIQSNLVRISFRTLWRNPDWDGLEPIPQARTPIVRAFHKVTKLDCDISFRHGLSVENTKLISLYMNLQPIARRLILVLKYWSQECMFHLKMSSYAISLMAIFYMQTKRLLYSLSELRNLHKGPKLVIAGWDSSFYNDVADIEIKPCLLTLSELLCDFFKYYSKFNFQTDVICPLLGRPVPKAQFHTNNGTNLPVEMKEYVNRVLYKPDCELFRSMSAMCIQDPFDLSHNLTKALPVSLVTKFKQACLLSYQTLEQNLKKSEASTSAMRDL